MKKDTIVLDLIYLLDQHVLENYAAETLIRRAISKLKENEKTIEALEKSLSNERWKGAITTGSY